MNKFITLIILITFFCSLLAADNSQIVKNTNSQAISAYHEKNYDVALNKFLEIENDGIINSNLFYNIANCYFRQSQLGKAVLYYKKALKVDPSHQQAANNLKFIQSIIKDKIEQEDSGALIKLIKSLYNSFDLNATALFTAILFFILILLLIFMHTLYAHRDKSLPLFLTILVIIMLIAAISVSLLKYNKFHSTSEAVITAQTAIGYSGPGVEYTRVFTIHEGMVCQIEDMNDQWTLIKLPNGIGGWINNSLLEIVSFKAL